MLSTDRFLRYVPDTPDMWRIPPSLRLDDLLPVEHDQDHGKPPLLTFIMVFSNYRVSQLPRCLECLARQTWRSFEVIVVDNGSTDGTVGGVEQFIPYVPGLRVIRIERRGFTSDPSVGIKAVMTEVKGSVIAIMQPEVMLVPEAARFLYEAHFDDLPATMSYVISRPELDPMQRARRWVALRVGFFDRDCQLALDGTDWHSNPRNVEGMSAFFRHKEGLSNRSNGDWVGERMPQWFVGSALSNDPIWYDMPAVLGHGSIDFYLLNYRHLFGYRDITPPGFFGYHQYHLRTAVAPIEDRGPFEQWIVSTDGILAMLDKQGRWPDGYPRREYSSPESLRYTISAGPQYHQEIEIDNLGRRVRVIVPNNQRMAEDVRLNIDMTPKVIPNWKPPDETPSESVRVRRAKGKT